MAWRGYIYGALDRSFYRTAVCDHRIQTPSRMCGSWKVLPPSVDQSLLVLALSVPMLILLAIH